MSLINPSTGRLTPETVKRLDALLGGDPAVEGLILNFIRERYAAEGLFDIPEKVAAEILNRPHSFMKAVRAFGETNPF